MKKLFAVTMAFALMLISGTSSAIGASRYSITDLGNLGGRYTGAYGINNNGQVVGYSETSSGRSHAFIWDSIAGMRDLGTLGGIDYSSASAINDNGVVVGVSFASNEEGSDTAVKWDINGIMTLGLGDHSLANGINNNGEIVGNAEMLNGTTYAFLWKPSGYSQNIGILGGLGGTFAVARDINDAGEVVGSAHNVDQEAPAFVWSAINGMQELGSAGGQSIGFAINSRGQIVGCTSVAGEQRSRACLWDSSNSPQLLGTMEASTTAFDVNSAGQIVGCIGGSVDHAFLWENGEMIDINSLGLSGWELLHASGINDSGQIVGSGIYDGQSRAFLLIPVPEPSSIATIICGMGVFIWRRFKK